MDEAHGDTGSRPARSSALRLGSYRNVGEARRAEVKKKKIRKIITLNTGFDSDCWVRSDRSSDLSKRYWTREIFDAVHGQVRHIDFRDRALSICHRCDVPACVNPDHLYLAEQQQNCKDAYLTGAHRGNLPKRKNPSLRAFRGIYLPKERLRRAFGLRKGRTAVPTTVHYEVVK